MLSQKQGRGVLECVADTGSLVELPLFHKLLSQYVVTTGNGNGNSGQQGGDTAFLYVFVSMMLHLLREQLEELQATLTITQDRPKDGAGVDMEVIAALPVATVLVRTNPGDFNRAADANADIDADIDPVVSLLKMQCPAHSVLYVQCRPLFDALMMHTTTTTGAAQSLNPNTTPTPNPLLTAGLVLAPPQDSDPSTNNTSACLTLTYGQHSVWQEVFSHVIDAYLLEMGAKRLSLPFLVQCYSLAFYYHMYPLMDAYADIFRDRYLDVQSDHYNDGNIALVSVCMYVYCMCICTAVTISNRSMCI